MRIVRHALRFTAVALAVSASATVSAAQVVQYYTTGTFSCAGCTGSGTGSVMFGDLGLVYASPFGATNTMANSTVGNPASVNLNVLNPSFASFGVLDVNAGSNTARMLNGTLTINFFQLTPSTGSASLVGSLSGTIAGTASNASFIASNATATIGDITYRFRETNYSLVPETSNAGRVTLQGEIRSTGFGGGPGGTVVPEPATVTLMGSGLLLTGLLAARRRRTTA